MTGVRGEDLVPRLGVLRGRQSNRCSSSVMMLPLSMLQSRVRSVGLADQRVKERDVGAAGANEVSLHQDDLPDLRLATAEIAFLLQIFIRDLFAVNGGQQASHGVLSNIQRLFFHPAFKMPYPGLIAIRRSP